MSGEHSTALRLATVYFTLTGGVTLLSGALGLVAGVVLGVPSATLLAFAASGVMVVATGFGALWTGRLLAQQRRLGGVVALATLLAPVVQWAVGQGPAAGVLFSLLGAGIVASVWSELE